MWYIVLVAAIVTVAKAQVFGALGCPTVKPQASFDLQKVSFFYYLQNRIHCVTADVFGLDFIQFFLCACIIVSLLFFSIRNYLFCNEVFESMRKTFLFVFLV